MLKDRFLKGGTLNDIFWTNPNPKLWYVSLLFPKSRKSHVIDEELIQPSITKVMRTVLGKLSSRKILLSTNAVQKRRIGDMAADVQNSM